MEGDISQMLRQVMENPQFGAMVQAVKSQLGTDSGGMPDTAGIMEKMPELLSALAPMMGSTAEKEKKDKSDPDTENNVGEQENGGTEKEAESISALPPVLQQFFRPGSREKRNRLLAALKPYLSPARCALVDRAMSAMQMGELLGTVIPQENSR